MFLSYLTSIVLTVALVAAQGDDPDALYRNRETLSNAQRAEQIWADRLKQHPDDFESAWKLARARYWLGGHVAEKDRKTMLESGIEAGRAAARIAPNKPDGHFWLAANMGALAESFGLRQGLKYRGQIKDELETVLRLDPGFLQGSADRALGRWYNEVPHLFGGSGKQSEAHLRKALTYNPQSTITLYFLAETLLDEGKKDEARKTLQQVLGAPLDPDWGPEDREFKDKARKLLSEISSKGMDGARSPTATDHMDHTERNPDDPRTPRNPWQDSGESRFRELEPDRGVAEAVGGAARRGVKLVCDVSVFDKPEHEIPRLSAFTSSEANEPTSLYPVSARATAIHVAVLETANRSGTDATSRVPPQR